MLSNPSKPYEHLNFRSEIIPVVATAAKSVHVVHKGIECVCLPGITPQEISDHDMKREAIGRIMGEPRSPYDAGIPRHYSLMRIVERSLEPSFF